MSKARPVLLAITSDQHSNSTIGLCPPQGTRLDDGGTYQPSVPQRWLWDNWLDFHARVAELRRALKARLVYVVNGDAFDGDHHETTQIITRDEDSQAYIATEVFGVVRDLKPDQMHVVRGTRVHVGSKEEGLGKFLGAVRDPVTKNWSAYHVRLNLNGLRVDCQHHTSVGGLPWTMPGGVARLAFRTRVEYLDRGLTPPDLIIRSHKHVHCDSYDAHKTRAIVTPAWQLKTEFGHRVAPDSIADVGGLIVVIQPDGRYEVRKYLYTPALPEERTA